MAASVTGHTRFTPTHPGARELRNVLLIGPPGAGKGTQALRIAQAMDVPVIAMGDTLRRIAGSGTAMGNAVLSAMRRGELLDDDLVIEIIRTRLDQAGTFNGFVLDGFPRTIEQAGALEILLEDRGPLVAVELAVPTDVLIHRLHTRRVCDRCGLNAARRQDRCDCGGTPRTRVDDADDAIAERLRAYERATQPLIRFYRRRGCLHAVDGTSAPDIIAGRILGSLRIADRAVS